MGTLAGITSEVVGEEAVVRITGEIDMSNAEQLGAQVEAAAGAARHLVVDLAAVAYINSQGLRMLQRLAGDVEARRLTVIAPTGSVAHRMLTVSGMITGFEVRSTPG